MSRKAFATGISALMLFSVAKIRFATAASCCGGASPTSAFTLPKFQRAMAGGGVQFEQTSDLRDAAGQRLHVRDWSATELKLIAGGAYRFSDNVQAGLSVPGVRREVRAGSETETAVGLGDIGLQVRYEILDEETCFALPITELTWFDMKPSIHWIVQGVLPSGRPVARSTLPLGADVTGRGATAADSGFEITKIWGRWGNTLFANAGYQQAVDTVTPTGHRWSAGAGVLYFFAYQHSLALQVGHRVEGGTVDMSSTQSSLQWSYLTGATWWRVSLGESGVWQGQSVPVTALGTIQVSTLWMP